MSRAYLNRTGLQLSRYPGPVMVYRSHASSPISSDLRWAPARGAPASAVWPPPGLHLQVELVLESNEVQTAHCALTLYSPLCTDTIQPTVH